MKHWKQTLTILLCLCMVLALAACGGSGGGKPDSSTSSNQTEPAAVPDLAPAPEVEPAPAEPTGPLPLSQFVSADGIHILYDTWVLDISWQFGPIRIFVFEDGKMACAKVDKTFGDLSKMTDAEIAAEVYAAGDAALDCPYFLYVQTDKSGNNVEDEYIAYYTPADGQKALHLKTNVLHTAVYDANYTGYGDSIETTLARGAGFCLDTVSAEGVELNPKADVIRSWFESYIGVVLYDGTVIAPPEDRSKGLTVHSLANGSNVRAEDIQFAGKLSEYEEDVVDISPAAYLPITLEQEMGINYMMGNVVDDKLVIDPEGILYFNAEAASLIFYNDSDEPLPADRTPVFYARYSIDPAFSVQSPAGPLNSFEDMCAAYGNPSGAGLIWKAAFDTADIIYYWEGDAFYLIPSGSGDCLVYVRKDLPVEYADILWDIDDVEPVVEYLLTK